MFYTDRMLYTCIKKVSGQKRVKSEYLACDSFKVVQGELYRIVFVSKEYVSGEVKPKRP